MTRNGYAVVLGLAVVAYVGIAAVEGRRPTREIVRDATTLTVAPPAATTPWAHWTVAEGVMPDGQTSVQFTLGYVEAQGWHVRAVSGRTSPSGYTLFDIFATAAPAPTSPYGTSCPGYPTAPFPGAKCYADGGWR